MVILKKKFTKSPIIIIIRKKPVSVNRFLLNRI